MSITYQIRKWAAVNKHAAQGLIALSTIALFFLGHVLGVLAQMLGWDPYAMFLIGAGTGILAWTLAPRSGETFPIRHTYSRQKLAVVIMFMSTCIGIGGWAIWLENFDPLRSIQKTSHQTEAILGPQFSQKAKTDSKVEEAISNWFHGGISKRVTKRLKRLFKPLSDPARALLTFLLLLVAIGALLGSLVLSCSLSCSGYQFLGILVTLGGICIAITALVWGLRILYPERHKMRINRKSKVVPDL